VTWGLYHAACIDCGETQRKHIAHGLCSRCYKKRRREGTRPAGGDRPWSSIAAACVACGRTDRAHRARGLCRTCYELEYRATEKGQRIVQGAQQRYALSDRGRLARSEANRRWREQPGNREKERLASRRFREVQYGIALEIPLGYEALVTSVFGNRCASCGCDGKLVLDHHRPLQDGHPLLHNAVPLCVSCNARKNQKHPGDFCDGWKLTGIAVLLLDAREAFEARFGSEHAC
jgi:hypothetical protein